MPTSINNYLPSINLHIGNPEDDKNCMMMIVDTSAAIITRNLQYHLWVIPQCSEMVDQYLQCYTDTTYDVVYLLAVFNLKDTN